MPWSYERRGEVEFRVRKSEHGYLAEAIRGVFSVRNADTCLSEPVNADCFFAFGKTPEQAISEVAKDVLS